MIERAKELKATTLNPSVAFNSAKDFTSCMTEEFGFDATMFSEHATLLTGGEGIQLTYDSEDFTGSSEVMRPFPGVYMIMFEGVFRNDAVWQTAWNSSSRRDSYFSILIRELGEYEIRIGEKEYQPDQNFGLIIKDLYPGDMHVVQSLDETVRYTSFLLTPDGASAAAVRMGVAVPQAFKILSLNSAPDDLAITLPLTNGFWRFIRSLWDTSVDASVRATLMRLKIGELFCLLDSAQSSFAAPPPWAISFLETRKIKSAQEILDVNYRSPPNYTQLSRRVGLNRRKLAEGFRSVFGMSIGEYCQIRRLEMARDLLTNTDKTVTSVANECGYDSSASFTRAYKRNFGISPRQARDHGNSGR
jgi:AraC-like DNA-binding protein